jgi:enolase
MSTNIYAIIAREILDSRGNPTVETMVVFESGYRGIAAVPAGASIGTYEAVELRDKDDKRYRGMGVLKAVNNVNTVIGPKLRGMDGLNQGVIDTTMIQLDGTPNKAKLGANAILSVSLATAAAASAQQRAPLYNYLNALFNTLLPTPIKRMPTPTLNLINGGKHGAGNLDFQEFHVVPATNKSYHVGLQMGVELDHILNDILVYRNAVHSVGDEGGFAPNLFTNSEAFGLIMDAIKQSPYTFGVDIFLGLDVAASHFKTQGGYRIKDKPQELSPKDFVKYLIELNRQYRLLLLEDPLDEDDWEGWRELTAQIGKDVLVIADDLVATNAARLDQAIAQKACSAVLLKPNQIGTLSEYLQVVAKAKKAGLATIVSHRSAETNDTFIADLGVAVQADYVKFGAPVRGERVAKYNRLLQIEAELFPQ